MDLSPAASRFQSIPPSPGVQLVERANGPIPRPVDPDYIWGAALDELRLAGPAIYVVNLETAITRSEDFLSKGINYRMSPENAECLAAAGIGCCILANNHVLDWGEAGLIETLGVLEKLGIQAVGAGRNIISAQAPAVFEVAENRRVIVFAFASLFWLYRDALASALERGPNCNVPDPS